MVLIPRVAFQLLPFPTMAIITTVQHSFLSFAMYSIRYKAQEYALLVLQ
nr:MAG TPA: hypothetical protein [Bacteriophage sp.]